MAAALHASAIAAVNVPRIIAACFTLSLLRGEKEAESRRVKYREIIAPSIKKRVWSLGYVSAIDSNGRTIWIADAHRDNGKRYVVRADPNLFRYM